MKVRISWPASGAPVKVERRVWLIFYRPIGVYASIDDAARAVRIYLGISES